MDEAQMRNGAVFSPTRLTRYRSE